MAVQDWQDYSILREPVTIRICSFATRTGFQAHQMHQMHQVSSVFVYYHQFYRAMPLDPFADALNADLDDDLDSEATLTMNGVAPSLDASGGSKMEVEAFQGMDMRASRHSVALWEWKHSVALWTNAEKRRRNISEWIPAYLEFSGAQVAILGSGVAKGITEDKFGKIPSSWSAQQILCSGLWVRVLATPELDDHGQTGPALRGVHWEEYMQPGQAEFTSWRPRQVKFVKHNEDPLIAVASDSAETTRADYILLSNYILPIEVVGNHGPEDLDTFSLPSTPTTPNNARTEDIEGSSPTTWSSVDTGVHGQSDAESSVDTGVHGHGTFGTDHFDISKFRLDRSGLWRN